MKRTTIALSVLAATLIGGSAAIAVAADGAPNPDRKAQFQEFKAQILAKLKAADTNGDGMISRDEANAASASLPHLAKNFDRIDANKDGYITLEEFQAAMQAMHHRHHGGLLKHLDKNGDGVISRDEAQAAPRFAKHFDEIDTNKDGVISKDELQAAHAKLRDRMFAKIDTDGDGRISQAEAQRFPRLAAHFAQIDTNGDGFLSREELAAAHAKHHAAQ